MTTLPLRAELPTLLGCRVAHVAATRGCRGRCGYCSPAALLCQERLEGRRAGLDGEVLRRAGVGGVRRRDHDSLCDELARLWHRRGVRYVYFVDEHLLPTAEAEAISYLERLSAGLKKRGVRRLGFGCMLRCDGITPGVARALRRAGLVRCFVGLEFASREEAARYGRRTRPDRAAEVLANLHGLGVATVSNLMLLHPESSVGSVQNALTWLAGLPSGAFELTQMMVYHGTRLERRLRREGRLLGNPLRYGYSFDDPVLRRFAQLYHRLRGEAFYEYSLALRCHDAALALALARRLRPGAPLTPISRRLDRLLAQVRSLQLAVLRDALKQALRDAGEGAADALIARGAERTGMLLSRLEQIAAAVAEASGLPEGRFAPMLAAGAGMLRFVVAGAALAACTGGPVPAVDQGPWPDAVEPDLLPCSAVQRQAQKNAVAAAVAKADPCFWGRVSYYPGAGPLVIRYTGNDSHQGFKICPSPEMTRLVEAQVAEVRKAIKGLRRDCLDGSTVVVTSKDKDQREAIEAAVEKICPDSGRYVWNGLGGVMVVLDQSGKVLEVKSQPGETAKPEAIRCVQKALAGLSFPCLAGQQLCTEHWLVE